MKSENIILQNNEVFKGRTIKPTDCITTEKGKLFYIDDNKVIGKCIVLKGFTYSPIEEHHSARHPDGGKYHNCSGYSRCIG